MDQDQSVRFEISELRDGRWAWIEDHDDRRTAEARRAYLSGILHGSFRVRRTFGREQSERDSL